MTDDDYRGICIHKDLAVALGIDGCPRYDTECDGFRYLCPHYASLFSTTRDREIKNGDGGE